MVRDEGGTTADLARLLPHAVSDDCVCPLPCRTLARLAELPNGGPEDATTVQVSRA